ncbi:hypothetical protein GmHk_U059764 [Glycine max]|nr:hypothetical protein GmHk_U059764 [Glycine max]
MDFKDEQMMDVIMEVGHSNIVQIVTDNAHEMVISEQWSSYKAYDINKAKFVKETLFDDIWWNKVDYILSFTTLIYDVLRKTNMDATSHHLVYEMWDSMIENVKKVIYRHERKGEGEESIFYKVVHEILIDCWTKSSSPLHCLAHSLNPRISPHQDGELTRERLKCFKRYFDDDNERRQVNAEFANFFGEREGFDDIDSLRDKGIMETKSWWLVHGAYALTLQKISLKLLRQPCSSWYFFR